MLAAIVILSEAKSKIRDGGNLIISNKDRPFAGLSWAKRRAQGDIWQAFLMLGVLYG